EAPPASGSSRIDLGQFETGVDVAFSIPDHALGFNIVVEDLPGSLEQLPLGIEQVIDPTGKAVHDDYTPSGGSHATSIGAGHTASVSVPQGDGVTTKLAGTWTLRVRIPRAAASKRLVKGTIYVQSTSDGAFHGGKLDLRVFVPEEVTIKGSDASVD